MNKYIAFLKVVECGSFTLAANELNYTQSAVSQMIGSLEKELKITLFIRSKHGLQLTYEGTKLLPFVRALVEANNNLTNRCAELNELKHGIVRIATFGTISGSILPAVLESFKKSYPNIIFEFHQGYYREIEHWISKDEVDFGITNIDGLAKYQCFKLFDDQLFLTVSKNHKFSGRTSIFADDLKKEPFIVLNEGDEQDFLYKLRTMNIEPDIRYRLCDDNSILAMVERGLGVAVLPRLAIMNRRFSNISAIPLVPYMSRHIGIAYKNKNIMSPSSNLFINYISKHINEYFPYSDTDTV